MTIAPIKWTDLHEAFGSGANVILMNIRKPLGKPDTISIDLTHVHAIENEDDFPVVEVICTGVETNILRALGMAEAEANARGARLIGTDLESDRI